MMHDRRPPEEALEWLRYAAEDLDASRVLLSAGRHPRQSLQSAQQAAEKALKAFLIGKGQPYPLTHSLEHLRQLCCAIDPSLDPIASACLDLTPFASLMRYPGDYEEPSPEQASAWIAATEALLNAVSDRLGGDGAASLS
jgi:HEPN domain-containing protein